MDAFLASLKAFVDTLGSTVLLPVFIFVFAVILGAKPGRAFRSAITIAVAFIGINLVIGLMLGALGTVSGAIVTNAGIQRDILDVGWPSAAAIAFGSSVGLWVIPIGLIVNLALLLTGVTKTLNVDLWNFWHYAFAGSLVVAMTNNLALGLVAAALYAALMLFFADWTGPAVQKFYNLPSVSIPHGTSAAYVPLAIPINWLLDRIPVVKDWNINPENIQKRLGPTFGDPMIVGLVIGLVLGVIGYGWPVFFQGQQADGLQLTAKILTLGVQLAASMVLLPRMVGILMEGLIPVSEAAREFMQKRAAGRDIYIGLDSAILIGHPSVISSALLLVPIAILLSAILPGNRVLLAADLAVIPFVIAIFAPMTRGNVFRIVVIGTIALAIGFYVGNLISPQMTTAAVQANFAMPQGVTQITSIADGFIWIPLVFMWLGSLGGGMGWLGLAIILAGVAAAFYFYNRSRKAWEVAAGAVEEGARP